MTNTSRALAFAGLFLSHAALAQAPVQADAPWARATAPQQRVGGVYVTLTSPTGDTLVGATTPAAGRVEIHEMQMQGDVMRMRELPNGLPLPAGQAVVMAPGGHHLMLMDLRGPLVAGRTVPVQLRFRNAPPLEVQATVAPVGAQAPASAQAPGHNGHTHGGHKP